MSSCVSFIDSMALCSSPRSAPFFLILVLCFRSCARKVQKPDVVHRSDR